MNSIFRTLLAGSAMVAGVNAQDSIWFDKPATVWETHALPIGNGSLGAMLFGGTDEIKFHFNQDTLWEGHETDTGSYQSFGHLKMSLKQTGEVSNYKRSLDISSAVHQVSYTQAGINFKREAFSSNPNGAIFVHCSADKKASYSGELRLIDDHGSKARAISNDTLEFTGKLRNGMQYAAQVKVIAKGGKVEKKGESLVINSADALTFVLVADTNYLADHTKKWRTEAPLAKVAKQLVEASKLDYNKVKSDHIADYKKYYDRVSIDLGESDKALDKLDTESRLKHFWTTKKDPDFEELVFNYGRYLLIASSREGTMPANLQGIWNMSNNPPWRSDYHSDINADMNYWLAESTQLGDLHQPFFDYVISQKEVGIRNTKKKFGINGWAVRYENGVHGGGSWRWNMSGSSWFAQPFWTHYSYTNDKVFLKEKALPVFRSVCEFWEGHLIKHESGTLVAPKGWSAEHGPVEDGVTYDQQFAWDALTNYIDACAILGVEKEYAAKMKKLRDQLMPLKIGKWGQLQEWLLVDRDRKKEGHRHLSHLVGLYPGRQLTPDQTALYEAAKISLNARGDGGAGWALPWKAASWARFNDGERAYKILTNKMKPILKTPGRIRSGIDGTSPNLLTIVWGVFQIDGSFGYTGAVTEMLLQSSHHKEGSIHFLPALPKGWSQSGSIKNFKTRGGHTVSFQWAKGELITATITKGSGKLNEIRIAGKLISSDDKRIKIKTK